MSIRFHRLPGLAASLVLASLALAPIALSGCQKTQELVADSAIEHARGGTFKAAHDGNRMVLRGGEMTVHHGDALPLPKDFPDDIYLPGDYRINSVMDTGGMQVISLQTPGKVSEVFGSARDAMGKQGWTQVMAMQNSTDTAMLTYEKEKRATVLSFNSDRNQQGVTMSVQVRSEQL